MPKDFLIVKNLYSGDLLFSSPDPLFLHLLSALGPSRLTYRGHTDSSHSLCLHLGLSNGEHQQKVEGALEIGAAALSSLAIFLQECHRLILFLPWGHSSHSPSLLPDSCLLSPLPLTSYRSWWSPAVSSPWVLYQHCSFTTSEAPFAHCPFMIDSLLKWPTYRRPSFSFSNSMVNATNIRPSKGTKQNLLEL